MRKHTEEQMSSISRTHLYDICKKWAQMLLLTVLFGARLPWKHPGFKGKKKLALGVLRSLSSENTRITPPKKKNHTKKKPTKKQKDSGKSPMWGMTSSWFISTDPTKANYICISEKVSPKQPKFISKVPDVLFLENSLKDYRHFYHVFVLLHYMHSIRKLYGGERRNT